MTYQNQTSWDSMIGGDGRQVITRIVANNDWNNAYDYKAINDSHGFGDDSIDSVLIYTVVNDSQMTVGCYKYPFSSINYSDLRNNVEKYKAAPNQCANANGSLRIINF